MNGKEKTIFAQIIGALTKIGISGKDAEHIESELQKRIENEPDPKIAFVGFSGVGKSSTLNALFNAGQPISHVKACTQQEKEIHGNYSEYLGSKGSVRVWDMPGMGEDITADKRHLETYKRVLPIVDVAVWTIQADYRAMAPMQNTILLLQKTIGNDFIQKLMFAINKADTIAPGETDWNATLNMPSKEQQQNIVEFENYVRSKVLQILPHWKGDIVSYSAKRRFRLEELLTAMVRASGSTRQWLLPNVADVANPIDLIDPTWLPYIKTQLAEKEREKKNRSKRYE